MGRDERSLTLLRSRGWANDYVLSVLLNIVVADVTLGYNLSQ
jgi:hypothetical protein